MNSFAGLLNSVCGHYYLHTEVACNGVLFANQNNI